MYSLNYIKNHKYQFAICKDCSTINYFTNRACSNCGSKELIHTDEAVEEHITELEKNMKSFDNIKITPEFKLKCNLCGKILASTNQTFINKTAQIRSYQRELWIKHRYQCDKVKARARQRQKIAKKWGDNLSFEEALIAAVWEF